MVNPILFKKGDNSRKRTGMKRRLKKLCGTIFDMNYAGIRYKHPVPINKALKFFKRVRHY